MNPFADPAASGPVHVPPSDPDGGPLATASASSAAGAIDLGVVGAGDPLDPPRPAARRRRGRLVGAIVGAVVVALVATGGAVVGFRLYAGSTGTLPEDVVPASTAGFARLNLRPGYEQRLAFASLLEKFPGEGSPEERVADIRGDLIDSVGQGLLSRADVDPWLGDRVGAGIWSVGDDPVLLVVAESRDDEAATRALDKVRATAGAERLGFVVSDGYALVAGSDGGAQAAAEAAVREARAGSLAASAAFRAAGDTLPEDQALLAYADLRRVGELMTAAMGEDADRRTHDLSVIDEAGGLFPGLGLSQWGQGAADLTGHLVIGARAADNGIEIRANGVGVGTDASPAPGVRQELDAMPGNSLAAGVVADEELGDVLATLAGAAFGFGGGPFGGGGSGGVGAPDEGRVAQRLAVTSFIEALRATRAVGFSLTDVRAGDPGLMVALRTRDAASAARLADAWSTVGGPDGALPVPVTSGQDGDRVEFTTPRFHPGGGRLADAALYREAMTDMPARAQSAFFVDVQGLARDLDVPADDLRDLAPVKAVAAAAGSDGEDTTAMVRIVIG